VIEPDPSAGGQSVEDSLLYEDVYADISNYSNLLSQNGVIFGDDFTFMPDVGKAVNKYCSENNKKFEVTENRYWRIL
jgi:hypothetical protein